ncbi:MAG: hypothetical protein P1V97_17725 [Planctomycetota bacterium]|nr:hypothetical protein [Planctomycetota bacterium]
MEIPKWPGRQYRFSVYTVRLLRGRLLFTGLIATAIGLSSFLYEPSQPTEQPTKIESVQKNPKIESPPTPKTRVPFRKFREQTWKLNLDKNGHLALNDALKEWQAILGHVVVVSEASLETKKIKILTELSELNWGDFKLLLTMHRIQLIEEEVSPGLFLIKAISIRCGSLSPDNLLTSIDKLPANIGGKVFAHMRTLTGRNPSHRTSISYSYDTNTLIMTGLKPDVIENRKLTYRFIDKLSEEEK